MQKLIWILTCSLKNQAGTLSATTDMQLDVTEAEDLMDEFFKEFNVDRGNFNINTYYPDEPFSWNPFKKFPVVMVPDFTIGMLIESAKAGKWLYD